ncbi:hypothetical protein BaRGS_00025213 [Batillaria attramentaria]|uniref:U4/U6.U5 tri-snRNP-associated protein 1 n=1 Tax=Batillaria attramentaria TaxID=370345 RepID=A0ABD0K8W3_9CAEN
MGSSKKHKDKDREREHKRKKHRRSRSRSRSRERKRRRQSPDDAGDRIGVRDKDRERDRYGEPSDFGQPSEPRMKEESAGDAEPSKEQLSLSIEETNKLRAKLGLKPLEAGGENASSKSSENQDVHVPAINLSEKKRTEKLREKMSTMKEKRTIQSKLGAVKGLGESDSEDDNAVFWVKKNRKLQKEKELAEKRAKLLEEMDEEFGVGGLVEQEFKASRPQANYTSGDLSGLKVEHAMEKFKEGSHVILTLKDKGVLDEEDDDVLMNVNIVDDERAEKNVENKKKKPDYKPYDEPEFDEYGMLKARDVLDKYDEEIHGAKKESFVLGSGGKYDAEHERNMEEIRRQLRQQGQSLLGPAATIASEYMTPEEMNAKFKKVKKKVRKIRKREVLKADDLQPLPEQENQVSHGSRSRRRGADHEVKMEDGEESSEPPVPPVDDDACFYTGITVKQEPTASTFKPPLPPGAAPDDEDIVGPEEDLSGVAVEEEELQQELQSMLHKTRRLNQRSERKLGVQKFCRTLGEIPTYGLAGNREEEREEIMDLELELMEQRKQEQEMADEQTGWNEVDIDTNPINIMGEEKSVLEEEPVVSASIGSALQLAMKKGYLENEPQKKHSSAPKHSHIQAQNYSIEDKRYDDLDEKYRKRDRYGGGMITDFKDKDGYKPEIRLEYVDDSGRNLNPKEAFRQLSHRFHGKGSGKKKTEKRQKKVEEENLMKQMSSTDTPLNTLSLLQDKQRTEKSPYVILSGNKTFSSNRCHHQNVIRSTPDPDPSQALAAEAVERPVFYAEESEELYSLH